MYTQKLSSVEDSPGLQTRLASLKLSPSVECGCKKEARSKRGSRDEGEFELQAASLLLLIQMGPDFINGVPSLATPFYVLILQKSQRGISKTDRVLQMRIHCGHVHALYKSLKT